MSKRDEDPDDSEMWREHKRQIQEKHAQNKIRNTDIISRSGIPYELKNNGESILFRIPGKPKIDFYPSSGRWCIPGKLAGQEGGQFTGGASAFLIWFKKQVATKEVVQ